MQHQLRVPRLHIVALCSALIMTILLCMPLSAHALSADVIVALTNQQRQAAGLAPLVENAQLNVSAHAKATDMFQNDYWSHFSPSGVGPWSFMQNSGYHYIAAGENLAKDFQSEADVVSGWMNSPTHRANILNPAYKDIGVVAETGTLVGSETELVVAHYGATNDEPSTPAPQNNPSPVAAAAPVVDTVPAPAAPTVASPSAPAAVTAVAHHKANHPNAHGDAHKQSFIAKLMAMLSKATVQYSSYYSFAMRRG